MSHSPCPPSKGSRGSSGLPRALRTLGMLLPKVFPQGSAGSVPPLPCTPNQRPKEPSSAPTNWGHPQGISQGTGGESWNPRRGWIGRAVEGSRALWNLRVPCPTLCSCVHTRAGSEALWAFPLSLKHSFTFQLSKSLKILTTLPLEPAGEPAQLRHGVQTLQLLTKPFLAGPVL